MIQSQRVDDAALRDTLDAVFAGPEFTNQAAESLLSRIFRWIGDLLSELSRLTSGSRALYYAVLILTVALIAAVVARALYVAHSQGAFGAGSRRGFAGAAGRAAQDPWHEAQRLAAAGDYTGAAHALYGAILLNVSRSGLVRLHDAKTIGDYLREMRARASASLVQAFREFARGYEYVVYGIGECDRERYERLHGLADRILRHG